MKKNLLNCVDDLAGLPHLHCKNQIVYVGLTVFELIYTQNVMIIFLCENLYLSISKCK